MSGETENETLFSEDGSRRAFIKRRTDDFLLFVVEQRFVEGGSTFWTPTHFSGLYETDEMAERDARAILGTFPVKNARCT
jgi:hypothetical protein